MSFTRVKICDDSTGSPECPCEVLGEVELPPDGHIPDGWPVRQCCRCQAWIIDLPTQMAPAAVECLLEAYPGSTARAT